MKHLLLTFFYILISTFSYAQRDLLREISLRGNWKFAIGDNEEWASPDYDVSKWEEIRVPSTWEDEGFYGYDGYAWYRINFDGSSLDEGVSYYLALGQIDDVDETYFNGQMIGFSGQFPPKFKTAFGSERIYKIPSELLNTNGENTIAVRVYDHYISGGILSGSIGIYSSNEPQMEIELAGTWKFKKGSSASYKEEEYDDEEWDRILVPMAWEMQNMRKYDGFGWYRKEITLTSDQSRDDWVLILGKIDDFDETYVNGEFVGETKDSRRYGESSSFQKLRIYEISSDVLQTGENIIAIKVEDIGNVGGIYEGPIGLIRASEFNESKLTRYFRDRY